MILVIIHFSVGEEMMRFKLFLAWRQKGMKVGQDS